MIVTLQAERVRTPAFAGAERESVCEFVRRAPGRLDDGGSAVGQGVGRTLLGEGGGAVEGATDTVGVPASGDGAYRGPARWRWFRVRRPLRRRPARQRGGPLLQESRDCGESSHSQREALRAGGSPMGCGGYTDSGWLAPLSAQSLSRLRDAGSFFVQRQGSFLPAPAAVGMGAGTDGRGRGLPTPGPRRRTARNPGDCHRETRHAPPERVAAPPPPPPRVGPP